MSRWGGAPKEKCMKCGKTVYMAEMVKMEGQIWHINCLRCVEENCNKKLSGANWGGFVPPDNSPYCSVHHKRLIQAKGSAIEFSGSTTNSKWNIKPGQESTPSPGAEGGEGDGEAKSSPSKSRFGGGTAIRCEKCNGRVYPAEMVKMDGQIWHQNCLRCVEEGCGKKLSGANWGGFVPPDNSPYCDVHHKRLLQAKGSAIEFSGSTTNSKWNIKPGQKASTTGDDAASPSTSSPASKPRWGGAPSTKCDRCGKTVYNAEMVKMEGRMFHGTCLRCVECNKTLTGANWGGFAPNDDAYCKIHLDRLIASTGSAVNITGSTAKNSNIQLS